MRLTTETNIRMSPLPAARQNKRKETQARIALFSAVDGALLDARTPDAGLSRRAVRMLAGAGIHLVPFTAMTLDEIAPAARELGVTHAIVEAGGAIARWTGNAWDVEPAGPLTEELLDVISEIEERSGASLLVYSVLPEQEAAKLSGRSGEMLWHSMHRRFSEPFVMESGSMADVRTAAESLGFSIRRSGNLFYLCRNGVLREMFARVRDELRCDLSIALGTSPLDSELLGFADVPIIVRGPDGEADSALVAQVPQARVAPAAAPKGWTAVIEEIHRSLVSARAGHSARRRVSVRA